MNIYICLNSRGAKCQIVLKCIRFLPLMCMCSRCLAPYIGYVIVQEHYQLAIGLLLFAGLTDLLDGFIARNWVSQASKLGSFLDPMADKLLVGSLVISLSCCSLFPAWLCGLIIFRDLFLIIAGFVIRYISLPSPRTLTRYFDATHVTAKLKPTLISKVNTAVQLTTIAASLAAPVYGLLDHSTLVCMWYFTGVTTAAAATSYIFSKDTYQLIRKRENIKTS
ncbi:probable cardiolipin synthase (CMP-forming) isoform X2 [Sitodiplosis mosellana]|uniref:probable cardiolipin synthase (CMP-forming) isoform X2 n=1 Tax=Sitodiplosis mosellana TaxID=263140 RepID=UPI002443F917|nr:probable cardiolipin synthase (CMP-forming) isoform X2 [Sitodiplosis mosellana]